MLRPRTVALLAATVTAAACGGSSSGPVAGTSAAPTPTAATSTPSSAAGQASMMLAVGTASGSLALYRIALGSHAAQRVRDLPAPPGGKRLWDLTVSRGTEPDVCAVWDRTVDDASDTDNRLVCYTPDAPAGAEVTAAGHDPALAALRPDGKELAWADFKPESNGQITVAARGGAGATAERYLADPSQPAGDASDASFTGRDAQALAWSGNRALVISISAQSDDGSAPVLFPRTRAAGAKGWMQARELVPPRSEFDRGYVTYDGITSATKTTALAVERRYALADDNDPKPPDRAVRVQLPTGQVLEVLATAAAGRYLSYVGGTEDAVVYRTAAAAEGNQDGKVYVRYRTDRAGGVITGLPADTQVIATAASG
ncbi:MAG: hypothetical protein LC789_05620 [Actinobacteria bacterium]|nr:hypothetical protein [Actinomycetota bacterium]MCA1719766.1 hypothetical protein [Actinomycetota bacterium]